MSPNHKKTIKTTAPWKETYSDPIIIKAGDRVLPIKSEDNYPGWIWCQHLQTGKEGWVPKSIINKHKNEAMVIKDYSAMELTVVEGERLEVISEESGWLFCRNSSQKFGWIPKKIAKY